MMSEDVVWSYLIVVWSYLFVVAGGHLPKQVLVEGF